MELRRAISYGLRGLFDFRGRMTRAEYLPFLAVATLAFALLLAAGLRFLPQSAFCSYAFGLLGLFYIPVTSAGCRRLRDAGQPPELMLNPLEPALAMLIVLWLISLPLYIPLGFTALYLTALVAAPFYALAAVLASIGVLVITAIYFTDTASRLLLPSARNQFSLSKVQK